MFSLPIKITMILLNGISEYIFFYIFYSLNGKKMPVLKMSILSLFTGVISIYSVTAINLLSMKTGLSFYLFLQTVNLVMNTLIMLALIRKNPVKVMFYSGFSYFIWYSFLFFADSIVLKIRKLLGMPTMLYFIPLYIVILLLYMILLKYLTRKYRINDAVAYISEKVDSLFKVLLLDIGMITASILLSMLQSNLFYQIDAFGVSCFISIIILVILIRYSSSRIWAEERAQSNEAMLAQQNLYIESLEQVQRNMRVLKHDYKNMITSLYLYSKEGNIEAIEQAMENLLRDFDMNIDQKMHITNQLMNVQVIEIRSILMEKIRIISHNQIPFSFEALYPITTTCIPAMDLARALGIILDNAIEEVTDTASSHIGLLLLKEPKTLTIVLENSLHHKVNIPEIYKEGFSTKGKNRGLGLTSYGEILEKYENVTTQTIVENNKFIQELRIEVI